MKISFTAAVEESPHQGLCVAIQRDEALYGSLMRAFIKVSGQPKWYKIIPSDLTTHLIVPLPNEVVQKLELQPGREIKGEIAAKEYKGLRVPEDVARMLDQKRLNILSLSTRQQRQGLLFIAESNDTAIRGQRIEKFIEACRAASEIKYRNLQVEARSP